MCVVASGVILVTGGTGYIGAWINKYLVDAGYTVVAAVRTAVQGEFILNRLPEYKGKISIVNILDIQKDGAYDEAVRGVDAIIHAASPVIFTWEDPQEVIGPAVSGATGILKSATKFGTKVQRVIITSSVAAIHGSNFQSVAGGFDENTWNLEELHAKHDVNSTPWAVYNTAKTLAEKSAFDSPGKPNFGSSVGILLDSFSSGGDTSGELVGDWVDVRDSAILHVLAPKNEEISRKRFLQVAHTVAWQDLYDVLNDAGYHAPGKNTKAAGSKKQPKVLSNNGKTFKYFSDFKYRPLKESIEFNSRPTAT